MQTNSSRRQPSRLASSGPDRGARCRERSRLAETLSRDAMRDQDMGENRGGWGRVLRSAALCVALTGMVPASGHALDIKTANNPDSKTITLEITGSFVQGDGLKLRALIAKLPPEADLVAHLNAADGLFSEAMLVGRFLHQAGVRTVIPAKAKCILPCPLAFLGGKSRIEGQPSQIKHSSASFGFSAFLVSVQDRNYTSGELDRAIADTQRNILQVADYLIAVEADIEFLKHIYDEARDRSTRFMANEDLLGLGINIFDDGSNQLIEALALRQRLAR